MRRKATNLELPTKTIRISTETYIDLSKFGSLADTYDSVIRSLIASQEKMVSGIPQSPNQRQNEAGTHTISPRPSRRIE